MWLALRSRRCQSAAFRCFVSSLAVASFAALEAMSDPIWAVVHVARGTPFHKALLISSSGLPLNVVLPLEDMSAPVALTCGNADDAIVPVTVAVVVETMLFDVLTMLFKAVLEPAPQYTNPAQVRE